MAVEDVFDGTVVWHSEIDPAASKVLAHHHPNIPNLGDITQIDWAAVQPVDILVGGFPCQDVSTAAVDRRAGMTDDNRSGLWRHMAYSIDALQPPIVIIENVRGLLSAKAHRDMESREPTVGKGSDRPVLRAAGAVFGDLADIGYNARWTTLPASAVGAPHKRERVFILATSKDRDGLGSIASAEGIAGNTNAPAARCDPLPADAKMLPTPSSSDGIGGGPNDPINRIAAGHQVQLIDLGMHPWDGPLWERYEAAINRWGIVTGEKPPPATVFSARGKYGASLNPAFAEWMMGWPDGWVTNPAVGIKRRDQLRIIGNGVCPQQAVAALTQLLAVNTLEYA
jgi:DNA (cytosine-5)-methyltransferase 1